MYSSLYTPPGFVDYEDALVHLCKGHWREVGEASCLRLRCQGSNNSSRVAQKICDNFKLYILQLKWVCSMANEQYCQLLILY